MSEPTIISLTQTVPEPLPPERLAEVSSAMTPAQLPQVLIRLADAGCGVDRLGCPRLIGQLTQAVSRPVDVVLCNGLDHDSVAPLQRIILGSFPGEVATGIRILRRLTGAARAVLVSAARVRVPSSNRSDERLDQIETSQLANNYPLSHPSLLLREILGRKLRPNRLPTEIGVLCVDAGAAWILARIVAEQPTVAPLFVVDHRTGRPWLTYAPAMLSIAGVLDRLGVPRDPPYRVLGGAVLRDCVVPTDRACGAGEGVIHLEHHVAPLPATPCIRCGWCADVCPAGVRPAMALDAAQNGNLLLAEQARVDACIGCGLCDYVCPSQLPLMGAIAERLVTKERPA